MKLAYPNFLEPITIEEGKLNCLVIENQTLFRTVICDFSSAINGENTNLVLSKNGETLDIAKNVELITDFINFDLNKKSLISKITSALEKNSLSPENYLQTQELLAEIEKAIYDWAFNFSCDIFPSKISSSSLLKAAGIELRNDYGGHCGEVEKILDYMELVQEFDREKLFVTVNMRTFFNDELLEKFLNTALSHEFKVLMLESQSYPKLKFEKRVTIDSDLCEF